MGRTRSDLIVPIRDRRQRRRIVTTRNLGIALGIFVLLFVGLSLWSEYGRRDSSDDYGRLFGTQVTATVPPPARVQEVVREAAPVPDSTAADPTLMLPAARAQAYGIGVSAPAITATTATIAPVPAPVLRPLAAAPSTTTARGGVTIVGGADGVTLTRRPGDAPLLKGGIFKDPPAPPQP